MVTMLPGFPGSHGCGTGLPERNRLRAQVLDDTMRIVDHSPKGELMLLGAAAALERTPDPEGWIDDHLHLDAIDDPVPALPPRGADHHVEVQVAGGVRPSVDAGASGQ